MKGFSALARAQWKGFYRDKANVFWLILFPLMFLFIFGFIFSGGEEPKKSELVQVGQVEFLDKMPADARKQFDELFTVTKTDNRDDAITKVKKGKADGVVEADGAKGLKLSYSQANQMKAATVRGTLSGFVDAANVATTGQKPTFSLATDQVEDKSLKAIQYQVPGILGYAVSMGAVFGAALALVSWRKTQLLRRMRLAPVTVSSLVGSRSLIALIVGLVQVAIFLAVGVALFGLKMTHAWYMVVPLALCGVLAFMAIGLFVGAVSKTEEAASGLANMISLPMAFLSGSFIPLDVAPSWLRSVSKFMPLNWLNEGMLNTMVRDQGPQAALVPCLGLLAFALVMGAISVRMFRWND